MVGQWLLLYIASVDATFHWLDLPLLLPSQLSEDSIKSAGGSAYRWVGCICGFISVFLCVFVCAFMLLQLCARLVRLSCYLIVCPSIHLPIHRLTQLFRLLISLFISLVLLVSCFCWFLSSFLFFFLYFWLHLICLFICQLSIYLRCCPHFIQALCCCPFETEYVWVHVYAAVIQ